MYNLLIVDDEEYICDSLYEIFKNRKELDLDIYKAYSANEALELLNRIRFDIVMTDIHMPQMTGIQLFQEINQRWINSKVIFLTAHSKFENIYTVNKYNNTKFLLKTEKIETIINTVKEFINEIKADSFSNELIGKAKNILNDNKKIYAKYFMEDLLKNKIDSKSINQELFEKYDIKFDITKKLFLVTALTNTELIKNDRIDIITTNEVIINEFENYMIQSSNCIGFSIDKSNIVWYIQPIEFSPYTSIENMEKVCFSIINGNLPILQEKIYDSLGISVSFAIGNHSIYWYEIKQNFEQLKRMIFYYHSSSNREILICYNDMENEQQNKNDDFSLNLICDDIDTLIREGDIKKIEDFYKCLINERMLNNKNKYYFQEIYYKISLFLLSTINNNHLVDNFTGENSLNNLMDFNCHKTWETAVEYLQMMTINIIEYGKQYSKSESNKMIEFLHNYINKNLSSDLSLISLADLVHYNPAYLSRIYKEFTGENIKKYISIARINKAKKLLNDSELKISAISELVGFEQHTNFGRFFKEHVGINPQDYRNSMKNIGISIQDKK